MYIYARIILFYKISGTWWIVPRATFRKNIWTLMTNIYDNSVILCHQFWGRNNSTLSRELSVSMFCQEQACQVTDWRCIGHEPVGCLSCLNLQYFTQFFRHAVHKNITTEFSVNCLTMCLTFYEINFQSYGNSGDYRVGWAAFNNSLFCNVAKPYKLDNCMKSTSLLLLSG